MNYPDLLALGRKCIKTRHDFIVEMTAWASNFQQQLSVIKVAALSCKETHKQDAVKALPSLCSSQLRKKSEVSKFEIHFSEITDAISCGLKRRETIRLLISASFKSQHLLIMLWWCSGAKS